MTDFLLIVLIFLAGINILLQLNRNLLRWKRTKITSPKQTVPFTELAAEQTVPEETATEEDAPANSVPASEIVKELLTDLQCVWEIAEDTPSMAVYLFSYQGGNFTVSTAKNNPSFRIDFVFTQQIGPDQLENVRATANDMNFRSRLSRVAYKYHAAKHQLNICLLTSGLLVKEMPELKSFWTGLLDSIYEHQRFFLEHLKERQNQPAEQELIESERELFLLREQEINLQNGVGDTSAPFLSPYSLHQFVEVAMDMPGVEIKRVKVVTSNIQELRTTEEIEAFQLHQALIKGEAAQAQFVHKEAQIVLRVYQPAFPQEQKNQTICLHLTAEKSSSQTLYFRVTYCMPMASPFPKEVPMDGRDGVQADSILIAYDKQDNQAKRTEMEYLWMDAVDKLQKGQEDQLTPEQKFIVDCTFYDNLYFLYQGKKAYLEKRFYEAVFFLERAYMDMQFHVPEMNEKDRSTFFELCYHLGMCYCHLQIYTKAYYYLDFLSNQSKITYTMAMVNVLTKSADFRAMNIINTLLDHLQFSATKEMEDENEDEQEVKASEPFAGHHAFSQFLLRRKVELWLIQEQFTEAEQLCKKLLKDPDSEKFALENLAYIQNQRKKEKPE